MPTAEHVRNKQLKVPQPVDGCSKKIQGSISPGLPLAAPHCTLLELLAAVSSVSRATSSPISYTASGTEAEQRRGDQRLRSGQWSHSRQAHKGKRAARGRSSSPSPKWGKKKKSFSGVYSHMALRKGQNIVIIKQIFLIQSCQFKNRHRNVMFLCSRRSSRAEVTVDCGMSHISSCILLCECDTARGFSNA